MKKLVTRDRDGKVINIGEWDEVPIDEPILAAGGEDLGAIYYADGRYAGQRLAATGEVIGYTGRKIPTNLMPEGATQSEEECVVGWDGGIYVTGDPRAVRG